MRIPFLSPRRTTPEAGAEVLGQVIYVFDTDGVAKPVGTTVGKASVPITSLNAGSVSEG